MRRRTKDMNLFSPVLIGVGFPLKVECSVRATRRGTKKGESWVERIIVYRDGVGND